MTIFHGLHFRNVRGDIFGGVTTAVVALPLALAFGVASGAGAIAGLYGAIFVGFFSALFGGTPAQVSGPTGPMTVVMTAILVEYAQNPAVAFTIVIMGGALQILFGLLRVGRFVTYVPFSVISGFMSGIGCIIIILQLGPLLGLGGGQEGVLAALVALPKLIADVNPGALAVGLCALIIASFMPAGWRKWAPSTLAALIVGTLLALMAFPGAPVIGDIPRGLPMPQAPAFDLTTLPSMIKSALILAVLGTIDSLLTSLIADNVTRTHHESDRELIGQGIGNMVAGLMGGIPGAGATMRTVVNVRAGGRTPISGALHSVVLLALVLGLAPLAEGIPLAVLAGILLKVGWDIIDWGYMRRLRRAPPDDVVVMFTVMGLTVFVDLITAVAVGIIMASLLSARQLSEHQLSQLKMFSSEVEETPFSEEERALLRQGNGAILLLHLSGPFSFCSANDMVRRLTVIGGGYKAIIFDFSDVPMIDTSIAMAIDELISRAHDSDQEVFLSGLGGKAVHTLERLRVLDSIPQDRLHRSRLDALRHASELVTRHSELAAPFS